MNGLAKKGGRHWNWSGDKVSYSAIHKRIRRGSPLPKLCEECGSRKPLDLANVTGIYRQDKKNWKFLCRRCHIILDGQVKNLGKYSIPKSQQ